MKTHFCDKCRALDKNVDAPYFIEVYDPSTKLKFTYYLCEKDMQAVYDVMTHWLFCDPFKERC